MTKYKRKFMVHGDTSQDCNDFCKQGFIADDFDGLPPCIRDVAKNLNRMYNLWDYLKEMEKCPHKVKLGKPRDYVVSEMKDGTWRCSCPQWKYRRKQCHHIKEAQENPDKYEMSVEFTGKLTEVFTKALET